MLFGGKLFLPTKARFYPFVPPPFTPHSSRIHGSSHLWLHVWHLGHGRIHSIGHQRTIGESDNHPKRVRGSCIAGDYRRSRFCASNAVWIAMSPVVRPGDAVFLASRVEHHRLLAQPGISVQRVGIQPSGHQWQTQLFALPDQCILVPPQQALRRGFLAAKRGFSHL